MDILLNLKDFENIINNYFNNEKNGKLIYFKGDDRKRICKYILDGRECIIHFYIKQKGIRPTPIKNKDSAHDLISFLETKGIRDDKPGSQIVIADISIFHNLITLLKEEYNGLIKIEKIDNRYRIIGYNNDIVTISLNKKNFVIQGKPYYVFHIIIEILAESKIDFDEYINLTNKFININTPSQVIKERIQGVLKSSHSYLTEPAIKTIATSFSYIGRDIHSDDYSCALTGVFKALESYLKKLLTQEYGYIMRKKDPFYMFFKDSGLPSDIESDLNIPKKQKEYLIKLYGLYSRKRSYYLHGTVDPINMPIIENYKDAESIRDEILDIIEASYNEIF